MGTRSGYLVITPSARARAPHSLLGHVADQLRVEEGVPRLAGVGAPLRALPVVLEHKGPVQGKGRTRALSK